MKFNYMFTQLPQTSKANLANDGACGWPLCHQRSENDIDM